MILFIHILAVGLVVLECTLWCFLLFKLFSVFLRVRRLVQSGVPMKRALRKSLQNKFEDSRAAYLMTKEISIWYYAFFCWRKKIHSKEQEGLFSYHRNSMYFGLYIVFVHEQVIEGSALHIWLHGLNPLLAWISTAAHIYSIIWLTGDYRALCLSRISFNGERLRVRLGIRKALDIPIQSIQEFQSVDRSQITDKSKSVMVAAIISIPRFMEAFGEFPQFSITLDTPVDSKSFLGTKRPISRVLVRVDNPRRFSEALRERLQQLKQTPT